MVAILESKMDAANANIKIYTSTYVFGECISNCVETCLPRPSQIVLCVLLTDMCKRQISADTTNITNVIKKATYTIEKYAA